MSSDTTEKEIMDREIAGDVKQDDKTIMEEEEEEEPIIDHSTDSHLVEDPSSVVDDIHHCKSVSVDSTSLLPSENNHQALVVELDARDTTHNMSQIPLDETTLPTMKSQVELTFPATEAHTPKDSNNVELTFTLTEAETPKGSNNVELSFQPTEAERPEDSNNMEVTFPPTEAETPNDSNNVELTFPPTEAEIPKDSNNVELSFPPTEAERPKDSNNMEVTFPPTEAETPNDSNNVELTFPPTEAETPKDSNNMEITFPPTEAEAPNDSNNVELTFPPTEAETPKDSNNMEITFPPTGAETPNDSNNVEITFPPTEAETPKDSNNMELTFPPTEAETPKDSNNMELTFPLTEADTPKDSNNVELTFPPTEAETPKDSNNMEVKFPPTEAETPKDSNNGNLSPKLLFLSDGSESGTEEDQSAFIKELESFFRERGMEFKPLKFYGEGLNYLKLWRAVMRLGGYDKVTSCKLWRQVGESFKPPKTCTTVSWSFRGFYEKALLDYEKYNHGGELNMDMSSQPEPLAVDNQTSGSGRVRRDAAVRAMEGWHSQRLLGNGEVSNPIIKDKSCASLQKHENKLTTLGLLKRKEPPYNDHAVKTTRAKASKQQLRVMLDITVADIGPPADWVKISVQKTKDCFEVYALVPGLLREEASVRVQSDPAGRLVISGEPENSNNPWGVTAFKKVVSLPARIDPQNTSAVVTLHGQLFVRDHALKKNVCSKVKLLRTASSKPKLI
ncbi:hypothetical protein ACFE04_013248 [Oxalis oulophora]